ncbi:hypothetical protein [Helicobacter pylori]|uniref:hypothetical protein n=1 Tax=Helicobacter pylori TaxID=210 RepID=UPI000ACEC8AB|nr:hypothetical protein [Helicobacter pylori]
MAVVGQALIPIPGVGALIGGFVGATLSETFFNALESGQESGHYDVAMIQSKQKGLENL